MHGFKSAILEKLESQGFMQENVQKGDSLKKNLQ